MRSKFLPWDLFKNFSQKVDFRENLILFNIFSPYIETILKERIEANLFKRNPDITLIKIFGEEINHDWAQEKLLNFNLFDSLEHYLILNAEKIPILTQHFIIDNVTKLHNKNLILIYNKVDTTITKKRVNLLEITPPRFWETVKIINFINAELEIKMTANATRLLNEVIPNDFASIYNYLINLKQRFNNLSLVDVDQIKEVVPPRALDKFKICSLLGQKKLSALFKELTDDSLDYGELRSTFSFLQNYMIKLSNPNFCANKTRLSKYDQDILNQSKLWKESEISHTINDLTELEIMSKKSDPFLKQRLRHKYLTANTVGHESEKN